MNCYDTLVKFAHLRTALVIVLAMLGSASVLALLIMTTNLLTLRTQAVSDVLPAQETLLLLLHPSPEDLTLFTQWFPVLGKTPVREGMEGVAVIALPDDGQAAVAIMRSNRQQQEEETAISLPPYTAYVSDPAAIPTLLNRNGTLTRYKPFHDLQTAAGKAESWTYATTATMQPPDATLGDAVAQLLLQNATHVGYVQGESRTELNFYGTQAPWNSVHGRLPENVPLGIALADGKTQWQLLLNALNEQQAAILPGLLQQWTEKMTATTVSWTYDLLPLLQRDGVVLVGTNASGALVAALGGRVGTPRAAAALDALLQEARQRTLPQYEVRERTFDNRFPSKDIRMRPGEQGMQTQRKGWQITESTDKRLLTARKERTLVVGTDETIINAAIESLETASNSPSNAGVFQTARTIALGTFNSEFFKELLSKHTGLNPGRIPLPLPTSGNPVQWELTQRGNIRTLMLSSSD